MPKAPNPKFSEAPSFGGPNVSPPPPPALKILIKFNLRVYLIQNTKFQKFCLTLYAWGCPCASGRHQIKKLSRTKTA